MDEVRQALQAIGGSRQDLENTQRAMSRDLNASRTKSEDLAARMQELENTQRAMGRDLGAAQAKSEDLATQMSDLRGAFASLGAIIERIWTTQEEHEARLRALERKAS